MRDLEIVLPTPHSGQREVLSTTARFNVLACGRRFGKTTLGLDRCATPDVLGYPVGWFSPTYKMLTEVWRTAVGMFAPIIERRSVQDHRLEFITGGTLEFWSLDNPDVARGRRYKRILVDEAAMISNLMDTWQKVLRPTLTDYKGDAWFMSTPKGRNGFWQMYTLGLDPYEPEWACWHLPTIANDHIDPAEIEAARLSLPESTYMQEYLAEFLEGEGSVFRNIVNCTTAPQGDPEAHRGHRIIAGADWAKQADYTAFSFGCMDCRVEVDRDRFNQIDYAFQVERLRTLCQKWRPQAILTELNSIGQPVFEQLERMGLPVYGFTTTATSKPPLIENMALALERAEWQFQPDKVWTMELEAYERKVSTMTGRSQYSAPDGFHDDTVIARALMLWQAQQPVTMQVVPQSVNLFGARGQSSRGIELGGSRGRR